MTQHVNKAEIIGNVGNPPDIRNLQDGGRVCNLSVATTDRWTGDDGQRKERTEWHRVCIYNENLIGLVEKHLMKGHLVRLVGRIKTRKWRHQDGSDRYTTEIHLGDFGAELTLLPQGRKDVTEPDSEAA